MGKLRFGADNDDLHCQVIMSYNSSLFGFGIVTELRVSLVLVEIRVSFESRSVLLFDIIILNSYVTK